MPSYGTVAFGPHNSPRPTAATSADAPTGDFSRYGQDGGLRLVSTDDRSGCIRNADQVFRDELAAAIPSLRAFARGLCGVRDMGDGLARDAMELGWAERADYMPGTSFQTWIFRILRNHFHAVIRSVDRAESRDPAPAANGLPAAPSDQDGIAIPDIGGALQALPPEQREVLLLVLAHGMSEADAASVVGCTIGTVKKRLTYGRKALVFAATLKAPSGLPSFGTMCLNQILKNEQVALMRYAAATDPAEIGMLRRKLVVFRRVLESRPYGHRPYPKPAVIAGPPSSGRKATRPAAPTAECEEEAGRNGDGPDPISS